MPKRFYPIFAAALLCLAALASPAMGASSPVATIKAAVGKVTLQSAGKQISQTAKMGMPIHYEDTVTTGPEAKAEVTMTDGSSLSIGADSIFRFSRDFVEGQKTNLVIRLFKGTMRALVKKLNIGIGFETPASNIGIRGTEFILTAHGDSSLLFLDSGKVDMTGADTTLGIVPGQASAGYKGRKPLPPAMITENPALGQARKLLVGITDPSIPASLKKRNDLRDVIARWLINYASYLLDRNRGEDARTALLIASELAARMSVKTEARMHTANIFAYRLKDPESALAFYSFVADNSPDNAMAGTALFNLGRCYYQLGRMDEAAGVFNNYVKRFPSGKNRDQVDFFLSRTPLQ